ncbi:MAG: hypothetical protein LKM33_00665 [Bacteroidales bacterium]|jgi:predicted extracellular nuclease|nr:hypothetical protein [Bacteroidales bacterium]
MKEIGKVLIMLVMFWNVENFFEPFDNPGSNDNDFTPFGKYYWTWKKFEKKRDDIAKVIISAGEQIGETGVEGAASEPPALIGLAEVENRFVLNQLVNETPLARLNYKIIHRDSQDERGIDVALLYRPSRFKLLRINFLPDSSILSKVSGGMELKKFKTRWVLYAKGIVNELDTLHVLVNHWPSKLGGEQRTLKSRMLISNIVRCFTDSILQSQPNANVILMGDFNDTPESKPLQNLSGFKNCATTFLSSHCDEGTHKYNGKWEMLDQFLLSQHLVYKGDGTEGKYGRNAQWIFCTDSSMVVFRSDFLLQEDKMFLGNKMKKTLNGPRYLGGASDHLPILLKVFSPQL